MSTQAVIQAAAEFLRRAAWRLRHLGWIRVEIALLVMVLIVAA